MPPLLLGKVLVSLLYASCRFFLCPRTEGPLPSPSIPSALSLVGSKVGVPFPSLPLLLFSCHSLCLWLSSSRQSPLSSSSGGNVLPIGAIWCSMEEVSSDLHLEPEPMMKYYDGGPRRCGLTRGATLSLHRHSLLQCVWA